MARKRKRGTWKERNPDAYRDYMKDYMARKRGKWVAAAKWQLRVGNRWADVSALAAVALLSEGKVVRLAG